MFSSIDFLAVVWFGGFSLCFHLGFSDLEPALLGLIVARFTALISIVLRLITGALRSCDLTLSIYEASGTSASTKCRRQLQRSPEGTPEVIRHLKIIK